ncbi:MAG: hypothetical protein AAGD11_05225 [Planctomycetota bacterium]
MLSLAIQCQPERIGGYDVDPRLELLADVARSHSSVQEVDVSSGVDNGAYINIIVSTNDVVALWSELRDVIANDRLLRSCIIACCEGDNGWDDYLLLFHFDDTVPTDTLT